MAISSTQVFHSSRPPNAFLTANTTSSSSNAQTLLASSRVSSRFRSSAKGNYCRLKCGFGLGTTRFRAMAMVKDGGERTEDHSLIDDPIDTFNSKVWLILLLFQFQFNFHALNTNFTICNFDFKIFSLYILVYGYENGRKCIILSWYLIEM